MNSLAGHLDMSRKQAARELRLSPQDPRDVLGRARGEIGMLFMQTHFGNVQNVFVEKSLLLPYTGPKYSLPIDTSSRLVVSDVTDLIGVLEGIRGYPEILAFDNSTAVLHN